MVNVERKFKVFRLSEINQIEPTLNNFDLGVVIEWTISMPDYRIIVLVIRYEIETEVPDEPKPKDDKPTK